MLRRRFVENLNEFTRKRTFTLSMKLRRVYRVSLKIQPISVNFTLLAAGWRFLDVIPRSTNHASQRSVNADCVSKKQFEWIFEIEWTLFRLFSHRKSSPKVGRLFLTSSMKLAPVVLAAAQRPSRPKRGVYSRRESGSPAVQLGEFWEEERERIPFPRVSSVIHYLRALSSTLQQTSDSNCCWHSGCWAFMNERNRVNINRECHRRERRDIRVQEKRTILFCTLWSFYGILVDPLLASFTESLCICTHV